jgi:hypothetical protein
MQGDGTQSHRWRYNRSGHIRAREHRSTAAGYRRWTLPRIRATLPAWRWSAADDPAYAVRGVREPGEWAAGLAERATSPGTWPAIAGSRTLAINPPVVNCVSCRPNYTTVSHRVLDRYGASNLSGWQSARPYAGIIASVM